MPVQIFQEISDSTGFPLVAVFYKSGCSPLYSFNILAMLLSMWVPHAAGIFQTMTNEGEVSVTFNTLWTGMKITSYETKGPISLPYNVLYMKAPIQIGGELDSQVRMMRYRVQKSSIHCILMNDWVSRPINLRILHLSQLRDICHNLVQATRLSRSCCKVLVSCLLLTVGYKCVSSAKSRMWDFIFTPTPLM